MASITQCISLLLIVFAAALHTSAADECIGWVQKVVSFSSEWSNNRWAAKQVIGRPNVYPACEHIASSWAPDSGSENEYIVVEIPSNLTITAVDLFETQSPGAAVQISSMNWDTGSWEELWSSDTPTNEESCPRIFSPPITPKAYATNLLNITFNTTLVSDGTWYELDAIRVNGTGVCIRWVESVVDSSSEYSATGWSANQVIGEPNVYPKYEDNPNSWAPDPRSANESIVVEFETNMTIIAVGLFETGYSGAAVKISSKNWETDSWDELWAAEEMMPEVITESRIFSPNITIAANTSQLKIDFDTTGSLWYELDAISVTSIVCSGDCPEGQYETQPCTPTSDRVCEVCRPPCTAGRYETTPCTTTSNRVCSACRTCPAGFYQSAPCTATSNRVCTACRAACPAGFYQTTPCTATTNRVCTACRAACPTGFYQSTPCTPTTNRVCTACSGACPTKQYRSAICTATSNRVCSACSPSCTGGKYLVTACTPVKDRVCGACSGPCPAGKYQSAKCSATSDRVCSACAPACTSGKYQATACTPTSNRVCKACSGPCPSGQVLLSPCTATKDRVCKAVSG